jgi:hypothetical protein
MFSLASSEAGNIQLKTKIAEPSSSTISFQAKEQMMTGGAKKIKIVEQNNIVIYDHESEED